LLSNLEMNTICFAGIESASELGTIGHVPNTPSTGTRHMQRKPRGYANTFCLLQHSALKCMRSPNIAMVCKMCEKAFRPPQSPCFTAKMHSILLLHYAKYNFSPESNTSLRCCLAHHTSAAQTTNSAKDTVLALAVGKHRRSDITCRRFRSAGPYPQTQVTC
jgi:hypothetical protein